MRWDILAVSVILGFGTTGCLVSKKQLVIQRDLATQRGQENVALQTKLNNLHRERDELQQTNESLLKDLEANKSELTQRVGELTRENQEMARKLRNIEQAKEDEVSKLKSTYEELVGDLKSEIESGEIKITQLQDKLSVNLVDRILFDSGKAVVKTSGKKVLDRVGKILKNAKDREIMVEGHTDNVPIGGVLKEKFASNWELSAARALNVVHYLQNDVKIDGNRLAAIGYGEHRPVAPNKTLESRARNRRIEIVLGHIPRTTENAR